MSKLRLSAPVKFRVRRIRIASHHYPRAENLLAGRRYKSVPLHEIEWGGKRKVYIRNHGLLKLKKRLPGGICKARLIHEGSNYYFLFRVALSDSSGNGASWEAG